MRSNRDRGTQSLKGEGKGSSRPPCRPGIVKAVCCVKVHPKTFHVRFRQPFGVQSHCRNASHGIAFFRILTGSSGQAWTGDDAWNEYDSLRESEPIQAETSALLAVVQVLDQAAAHTRRAHRDRASRRRSAWTLTRSSPRHAKPFLNRSAGLVFGMMRRRQIKLNRIRRISPVEPRKLPSGGWKTSTRGTAICGALRRFRCRRLRHRRGFGFGCRSKSSAGVRS